MGDVIYQATPKPVASLRAAPNANTGGQLYNALLQVKKHGSKKDYPEDEGFFEIATFGSRSSAASTVTNIKNGKRHVPEGQWVFTSRSDSATNTSVLFAKYLGES